MEALRVFGLGCWDTGVFGMRRAFEEEVDRWLATRWAFGDTHERLRYRPIASARQLQKQFVIGSHKRGVLTRVTP